HSLPVRLIVHRRIDRWLCSRLSISTVPDHTAVQPNRRPRLSQQSLDAVIEAVCRRAAMELAVGKGALLLLLVAAVVAMLMRKLRLSYSVGLVAAGMALTWAPLSTRITLSRELILDWLLPPLIFEAAFYLRWSQLRRELPLVFTLATAGVV